GVPGDADTAAVGEDGDRDSGAAEAGSDGCEGGGPGSDALDGEIDHGRARRKGERGGDGENGGVAGREGRADPGGGAAGQVERDGLILADGEVDVYRKQVAAAGGGYHEDLSAGSGVT